MPNRLETLETRVSNSLQRLGFESITARQLGDGCFELTGDVKSLADQRLVLLVTPTVAGVTAVVNRIQVESAGDSDR